MINAEKVRTLALAFEETEEQPHFEKPSFRVKKKIFATIDHKNNRACLKLGPVEQSVFCDAARDIVYPVPNAWGKQGWTFVDLEKAPAALFKDALTSAYCRVAPPKLAAKYKTAL